MPVLFWCILIGERYGSSRSLVAELHESITICYRRLGDSESALLFSTKSVSFFSKSLVSSCHFVVLISIMNLLCQSVGIWYYF